MIYSQCNIFTPVYFQIEGNSPCAHSPMIRIWTHHFLCTCALHFNLRRILMSRPIQPIQTQLICAIHSPCHAFIHPLSDLDIQ